MLCTKKWSEGMKCPLCVRGYIHSLLVFGCDFEWQELWCARWIFFPSFCEPTKCSTPHKCHSPASLELTSQAWRLRWGFSQGQPWATCCHHIRPAPGGAEEGKSQRMVAQRKTHGRCDANSPMVNNWQLEQSWSLIWHIRKSAQWWMKKYKWLQNMSWLPLPGSIISDSFRVALEYNQILGDSWYLSPKP